jgi:hypothetical protein
LGDLSTIRFACCGANRNWAWGMNFIDYEHFVYVWNNVEHVSGPCDCDGFDCKCSSLFFFSYLFLSWLGPSLTHHSQV